MVQVGTRLALAAALAVPGAQAAGMVASPAAQAAARGTQHAMVGKTPNPGPSFNEFTAVSAVSDSDVWAVGTYNKTRIAQPLVAHWNGTAWSQVASPSVGAGGGQLDGVAAVSASDVWAVGVSLEQGTDNANPLIEHWNGTAWSLVASPAFSTPDNGLTAITADSATDIWAVGYHGNLSSMGPQYTMALHWNGTAWSQVPTPSPSPSNLGQFQFNELDGVSATSPSNAWAVGGYDINSAGVYVSLTLHWNGTAWSQVPSPNPANPFSTGLSAVSASGSGAVAVGASQASSKNQAEAMAWQGGQWVVQTTPEPGRFDNGLAGVSALSPTDVWAVGDYGQHEFVNHTLVLHWDGTAWSRVPSPAPGTSGKSQLNAVTALSDSDVWAVGSDVVNRDYKTLAMHWNGTTWTVT